MNMYISIYYKLHLLEGESSYKKLVHFCHLFACSLIRIIPLVSSSLHTHTYYLLHQRHVLFLEFVAEEGGIRECREIGGNFDENIKLLNFRRVDINHKSNL